MDPRDLPVSVQDPHLVASAEGLELFGPVRTRRMRGRVQRATPLRGGMEALVLVGGVAGLRQGRGRGHAAERGARRYWGLFHRDGATVQGVGGRQGADEWGFYFRASRVPERGAFRKNSASVSLVSN